MKLVYLFVFLSFNTFSQSEDPSFPGGLDSLYSWVVRNTVYPLEAGDNAEYGKVVVEFIVEKDGTVSSPKIKTSVSRLLDSVAIDVISRMPKWETSPSSKRSRFILPIFFEFDNEIDPSLLLGEWIFCTNDTNYYFDSKTMSDTTVFYNSNLNSLRQKCSFEIKIRMYKKANVSLLDITAVEQGIELSEKNLPYIFNSDTNILSFKQNDELIKFKVKSLSVDKMTLIKL
jgi:TonB family protein